jgi:hypothetical protein
MSRQGPLPLFAHGVIEYAAAVLFLAAPFLFGFQSGVAVAAAIAVGVLLIFVAATTDGPTSLVDSLPLSAHIALDYVLAIALIAAPFVLGFSDETDPTAFFIAVGVVHLLVTIATRYRAEATPAR